MNAHGLDSVAHTGFVLLIRLSQYQTSSGLGLWEARWELSGHSDWRKISLQISCGQKIWLIPRRDNGWSSLTLGTSVCAQIMSQQDRGECSYWSDPPHPPPTVTSWYIWGNEQRNKLWLKVEFVFLWQTVLRQLSLCLYMCVCVFGCMCARKSDVIVSARWTVEN